MVIIMKNNQTPLFPYAELVTKFVADIYEKTYVEFAMEDPYNYEKVKSGELTEADFALGFGREGEIEILEISKSFILQNWIIFKGESSIRESLELYVQKWLRTRNELHAITRDDFEGMAWRLEESKNEKSLKMRKIYRS